LRKPFPFCAPEHLTNIVNTADGFDHLGLRIGPDIDAVASVRDGLLIDRAAVGVTIRILAAISG
jgi:hypothetical protein